MSAGAVLLAPGSATQPLRPQAAVLNLPWTLPHSIQAPVGSPLQTGSGGGDVSAAAQASLGVWSVSACDRGPGPWAPSPGTGGDVRTAGRQGGGRAERRPGRPPGVFLEEEGREPRLQGRSVWAAGREHRGLRWKIPEQSAHSQGPAGPAVYLGVGSGAAVGTAQRPRRRQGCSSERPGEPTPAGRTLAGSVPAPLGRLRKESSAGCPPTPRPPLGARAGRALVCMLL